MRSILKKFLASEASGRCSRRATARRPSSDSRRGDVDLALVDWNMPRMNGLDFVWAMRADHAFDGIRVMMVTTEAEPRQMARALEAGANEYVMKPFTTEVLETSSGSWASATRPCPRSASSIVDDSVVVRRLVDRRPRLRPGAARSSASAANGRIALAKIPQVNPDVVTLDIEMPEMDGLETLAKSARRTLGCPSSCSAR